MAQTLTFSREQLLTLADSLRSQNPGLTQSQLLTLAQNEISVIIPISLITTSEPPRLALPQRIFSLQLGTQVYTDPVQWTQRWRELFAQAESRGVAVTRGQYQLQAQRDVVTRTNAALSAAAATATETTAAQFVTDVVVTDVEILSSAVVVEFSNGTSRSLPILGPKGDQGPAGPGPTITIGTVVESESPFVTAIGSNGNYTLNFGLKTGGSDIITTGSYDNPSWITSLSKVKVGLGNVTNDAQLKVSANLSDLSDPAEARLYIGLGNVTNESKATMFANPQFTGTVTGITAAMVGLGNVTNESKATMFATATLTGSTEINSVGVGVSASGVTGEIRATNEITAYYSSDRRLKENIEPIANALDKLAKITGVMFDWRDEVIAARGGEDGYFVRRRDTGVIAQDVEAVLPEAVAEREDGVLAVRYDKLAGLIIEAIKELKIEIDQIKSKL